jgi:hypothetical protein
MQHQQLTRTMVVLADSFKHGEHCIAGKCLTTRQWIRPVSTPQGGQISSQQARSRNPYGVYPVKPLQKIRMAFADVVPLINQPENHLIAQSEWQQNYTMSAKDLKDFLDHPQSLWGQGNRVSFNDIRNGAIHVEQSLFLIQTEGLVLHTTLDSKGKCKRRASFTYNHIDYDLPVTCRNFDDIHRNQAGLLGIMCVSLGEPFEHDGCCYKIAAAIY